MALLSGTAAKVALDLLKSGRAFEKDGVKMFERALRVTQRGEVPEGAVSEFRKLVDGLEAEAIQRRLRYWKPSANRGATQGPSSWSKLRMNQAFIPQSVNYWIDFASGYDNAAADFFRRQAALTDKKAGEISIERPRSVLKVGSPAYTKQRLRKSAAEDRTNATIIEALVRLFGEKGPA